MQSVNELLPGLWLGNMFAARDVQFYLRNHITVVVNCTPDVPFLELGSVTHRYRVAIDDVSPRDSAETVTRKQCAMARAIREMMPIIDRHRRGGDQILIHCVAGMQRSAIIAMSYMYETQTCSIPEAFYMVKLRRPIAFTPRVNFARAFRSAFESRIAQRLGR